MSWMGHSGRRAGSSLYISGWGPPPTGRKWTVMISGSRQRGMDPFGILIVGGLYPSGAMALLSFLKS